MATLKLRRIPCRYRPVLISVALSVAMAAVVTFVITLKTVGFSLAMPAVWLAEWQLTCAIAVPARFVVAPLVNRFVSALVEPPCVRHG